MKIIIKDIITSTNAITTADGKVLYEHIKKLKDTEYSISFDGINRVSTGFLNSSIGKLFIENTQILSKIDFASTKNLIKVKLDSVISNARQHESYNEIVNDASNFC